MCLQVISDHIRLLKLRPVSLYKLVLPKNDMSRADCLDEVTDTKLFISHKTLYK